jgi:hypothetical protein
LFTCNFAIKNGTYRKEPKLDNLDGKKVVASNPRKDILELQYSSSFMLPPLSYSKNSKKPL